MAGAFKPTFLSLPREARDRIYLYVFHSSIQTPPSTPDEVGERETDAHDRYCPSHVAYETEKLPGIVPSFGLLSCCHQTRSELQEFITREDRNERKQPLYQLDCILERFHIVPTWVLLPSSLAHVHRLEVNIRVFYVYNSQSHEQKQLFIRFPGIFDLLYRLFNHGPHFYRHQSRPNGSFIRTLILHLSDEVTKHAEQPQEPGTGGSVADSLPASGEVSPHRVWECIRGLDSYGLLRGRVETIRICFGSDIKEIQVDNNKNGRARVASSSEWLAWLYRWPRNSLSHPLDT